MVSWAEFQRLRPDLAEAGRRLLYQFGVGLLHPSPKRQDLHRDGRYALHCFPPDDNEDAFVVSGRAMLITDPSRLQQATAQFLAERQLVTAPEASRPRTSSSSSSSVACGHRPAAMATGTLVTPSGERASGRTACRLRGCSLLARTL